MVTIHSTWGAHIISLSQRLIISNTLVLVNKYKIEDWENKIIIFINRRLNNDGHCPPSLRSSYLFYLLLIITSIDQTLSFNTSASGSFINPASEIQTGKVLPSTSGAINRRLGIFSNINSPTSNASFKKANLIRLLPSQLTLVW